MTHIKMFKDRAAYLASYMGWLGISFTIILATFAFGLLEEGPEPAVTLAMYMQSTLMFGVFLAVGASGWGFGKLPFDGGDGALPETLTERVCRFIERWTVRVSVIAVYMFLVGRIPALVSPPPLSPSVGALPPMRLLALWIEGAVEALKVPVVSIVLIAACAVIVSTLHYTTRREPSWFRRRAWLRIGTWFALMLLPVAAFSAAASLAPPVRPNFPVTDSPLTLTFILAILLLNVFGWAQWIITFRAAAKVSARLEPQPTAAIHLPAKP